MRLFLMLLLGMVAVLSVLPGKVLAQKKKPAPIAPAEPLKDGWEEIDKRLVFLMVRLANVEASLDAVEKRVGAGTRQGAAKAGEAKRAESNNERMDRKGGGPVKWSEFYGRTAEKFFYHPTDRNTSYHTTTVLGQRSPQNDNQSADGIPSRQGLPVHQRPPQFDYIYKANRDAQARAEKDASELRNKVEALVARRRQLEDEQSALWCQIAFRLVSRYELPKKPLYRFEPVSTDPDTESRNHAETVKAAAIFMRRALSIVEVAEQDQAKAFGSIKVVVNDACDKLDDAWLHQGILTDESPNLKTPAGKFAALSKKLKDVSENLSDSYVVAIDGDRFKDEVRKDTFRGLLQESLVDYAQIVLALNEMSLQMASEWKTKPDLNTPLKFVSLEVPERVARPIANQAQATDIIGDSPPIAGVLHEQPQQSMLGLVEIRILRNGNWVRHQVIHSGDKMHITRTDGSKTDLKKDGPVLSFATITGSQFSININDRKTSLEEHVELIFNEKTDGTQYKRVKQKGGVTTEPYPVAIYKHKVPGRGEPQLTFLSNGTIQGRNTTWRINGKMLTLDWANPNDAAWHDELRVSDDGLSYYGKNQSGVEIRGYAIELSRDWHKLLDNRR